MVPRPVTTPSPGMRWASMPNWVERCSTNRSVSSNEPSSSRTSMRSRAVSLPLACWLAMRFSPPPRRAPARRCSSCSRMVFMRGLLERWLKETRGRRQATLAGESLAEPRRLNHAGQTGQLGDVGGEGAAAVGGEGGPGALAAGGCLFAQLDIAGVLELFQVFGQDGVRDGDGFADRGELGLFCSRQDGADLQTAGRVDDGVELRDAH